MFTEPNNLSDLNKNVNITSIVPQELFVTNNITSNNLQDSLLSDEYAAMLTNLRALNLSEESHPALNTSSYLNAQLSTLTERVILLEVLLVSPKKRWSPQLELYITLISIVSK